MDAVCREYNIPKDSMVKSVTRQAYSYQANQGSHSEPSAPAKRERQETKQENAVIQAQKILLTWLLDEPGLLGKIETILDENGFSKTCI